MKEEKILIYRMGYLGDTLAALPAIWAVRNNFPRVKLYLLSQKESGARVLPREIFGDSAFFEQMYFYHVGGGPLGTLLKPFRLLALCLQLALKKFDAVVYLPPPDKDETLMERDKKFFKSIGIRKKYGFDRIENYLTREDGKPLPEVPHEADLLLLRLKKSGLEVPAPGMGKMDLSLAREEEEKFKSILTVLRKDSGRPWVGIGPSAVIPVNVWPADHYQEVVRRLVEKYNIWPVVFGGAADRELGEKLVQEWGCGYNLAGLLTVRLSAVGLRRCRLYIGNDTGTTHLAAAVQTPCVAVYSSRQWRGLWYPYGPGHHVFRTAIECEGCKLNVCIEKKMECILSIQTQEVARACGEKLEALLR